MACSVTAHREDGGVAWMCEEGDDPGWVNLGRSAARSWAESLELGSASMEMKKKNKVGRMKEHAKNKDKARWAAETISQI
jgi:hypothetical protein